MRRDRICIEYTLKMHIQRSDETSPAGELKESSQPCNANHLFPQESKHILSTESYKNVIQLLRFI